MGIIGDFAHDVQQSVSSGVGAVGQSVSNFVGMLGGGTSDIIQKETQELWSDPLEEVANAWPVWLAVGAVGWALFKR